MDSRRRARREAREEAELAKHRAERPKLQQQFADLKRGLAVVTDAEWENIPDVGNLTRRKRRREERSFAVPDSIIVGDRGKGEYENALDSRQQVCYTPAHELYVSPTTSYQEHGGFETPADSGTLTNFVEIGQARDKILSLKLDQVRCLSWPSFLSRAYRTSGFRNCHSLWFSNVHRPERIPYFFG